MTNEERRMWLKLLVDVTSWRAGKPMGLDGMVDLDNDLVLLMTVAHLAPRLFELAQEQQKRLRELEHRITDLEVENQGAQILGKDKPVNNAFTLGIMLGAVVTFPTVAFIQMIIDHYKGIPIF